MYLFWGYFLFLSLTPITYSNSFKFLISLSLLRLLKLIFNILKLIFSIKNRFQTHLSFSKRQINQKSTQILLEIDYRNVFKFT